MAERSDYREEIITLLALIMLKVALLLVSPFLQLVGAGRTSLVTAIIYAVMMAHCYKVILRRKRLNVYSLGCLLGVLLLFVLSYALFPNTREYFFTQDMLLIYLLYLPVSVFLISQIKDWRLFFERGETFAWLGLAFVLPIFMLDLTSSLNYMEFSYSLLPLGCLAAVAAGQKARVKSYICFVSYVFFIFVFGARGPLLFLLASFVLSLLLNRQITKKIFVVLIAFLSIVVVVSLPSIQDSLFQFASEQDSYVLSRLVRGNIFESTERDALYEGCRQYIRQLGLRVNGFFGDRSIALLYNQPYAHSIVYESIISFGWIGGCTALSLIAAVSVKVFLKGDLSCRLMLLYIWFAFCGRFFVSGSFVMEGRFYLFLGVLASLSSAVCGRRLVIRI